MVKDESKYRLNQSVCGVCYQHTNLRKYILWALRLLEDMPFIFSSVKFLTADQVSKERLFDVYIVDDFALHKTAIADLDDKPTITVHIKSKSV